MFSPKWATFGARSLPPTVIGLLKARSVLPDATFATYTGVSSFHFQLQVGALGSSQFAELLELPSGENTVPDDGDRGTAESVLGYFGSGTPLTHGEPILQGWRKEAGFSMGALQWDGGEKRG
jgi:hypothetical protein